jgi:hypothetical protein
MIGMVAAGLTALTMASAYARSPDPVNVVNQPDGQGPALADPQAVQAKIETAKQQAALVNQITDKFQAEAAAQFRGDFNALDWKLELGSRLMLQPASALATAVSAGNIGTMQSGLASVGTAKHASDNKQVITLLPNPCRIVDTRLGGGGMLGPSFRFWYAFNTTATIAGQGGYAGGCGSFPDAASFLLYVTVVPPGAPLSGGAGFLSVQHDATGPTTSTMNYYPGINAANFAVAACAGCGGTTSGAFYAYASSPTHVIVDLVGVGGPLPVTTMWASINADGTTARGSHTVSSAWLLFTGQYEVIFDRNVTACAFTATIGVSGATSPPVGQAITAVRNGTFNGVFVLTTDSAGTASSRPFHVAVNCP